MTESTARAVDTWIKVLGVTGLALGGAIGLWEYAHASNERAWLETRKFEAEQRKALLDKQVELYFKVADLASTISLGEDKSGSRERAITEFHRLYYGQMVIVEDRQPRAASDHGDFKYSSDTNVERRMIAFNECLTSRCERPELSKRALELADSCRNALALSVEDRIKAFQRRLGVNIENRQFRD
jgi:hypothetical protein